MVLLSIFLQLTGQFSEVRVLHIFFVLQEPGFQLSG